MRPAWGLLFCLAVAPTGGFAADDLGGFDAPVGDEFGGFDAPVETASAPSAAPTSRLDIDGSATLSAWYGFARKEPPPGAPDYRGVNRLRAKLIVEAEADLSPRWKGVVGGAGFYDAAYAAHGRDAYPESALAAYESEFELREAYVRGRLAEGIDVVAGRQIAVWGTSDNLRVVDVINPIDNRQPGMTDIEDIRLPVGMVRVDAFAGAWRLSLLVVGENRFDKLPADGGPYDPSPGPSPVDTIPDGAPEYGAALTGVFSGWDLSFHFADVYDNAGRLDPIPGGVRRVHDRVTLVGVAADVALGDWIVKGEAARITGGRFFADPTADRGRTDGMVGLEYYGLSDQMVAVEGVARRIDDHLPRMASGPDGVEETQSQWAIRYTADLLRDRLHLLGVGLFSGFDGAGGGVVRLSAGYDLAAALTATGGATWYRAGDEPLFAAFDDNDTLFIDLKYSF